MNKIDRRILKTEKAIKEAFLHQAKENNADKISVTSIAKEANITRKTFYDHYENIKDLSDKIMQDLMHQLKTLLAPLQRGQEMPSLKYDAGIVNFFKKNQKVFNALWKTGVTDERLENIAFVGARKSILKQLEKRNMPKDWNLDKMALNLSNFLFTGVLKIFRSWLSDENPLTTEQMIYILYIVTIIPFEAPSSMNISIEQIFKAEKDIEFCIKEK